MITYNDANNMLQGRCKYRRKIANNTWLGRRDGCFTITYHNTNILTIYGGDLYEISMDGWDTKSTLERIQKYTGMRIARRKGYCTLYILNKGQWPQTKEEWDQAQNFSTHDTFRFRHTEIRNIVPQGRKARMDRVMPGLYKTPSYILNPRHGECAVPEGGWILSRLYTYERIVNDVLDMPKWHLKTGKGFDYGYFPTMDAAMKAAYNVKKGQMKEKDENVCRQESGVQSSEERGTPQSGLGKLA